MKHLKFLFSTTLFLLILWGIGICQIEISESDSIRLDSIALSYKSIGVDYFNEDKIDSAIIPTKKALYLWAKNGNRKGQANALQNLGSFFRFLSQLDSSIIYYKKIFEVVPADHKFALKAFEFIGNNYERLNNFVNARKYYLEGALAALNNRDSFEYVSLHDFYAKTYSDFNRDSALILLQKTEPVYESLAKKYPLNPVVHDYANNLNAQGVLFEHQLKFEKALEYYKKYFRTFDDYYQRRKREGSVNYYLEKDYVIASFLFLNNTLNVYAELEQYGQVEKNLKEAEIILEQIKIKFPGEYPRRMTNHLLTSAHISKTRNRYSELEPLYRRIFTVLVPGYEEGSNRFYPEHEKILSSEHKDLLLNAMINWCKYWDSNQVYDEINFEKTIPMYALADHLVDQLMESQDSRRAIQFWRTAIMPMYASAFELAAKQDDLQTAFYYAEKSKAVGLLAESIASKAYDQLDDLTRQKLDCKKVIDSLNLVLGKPGLKKQEQSQLEDQLQRVGQNCNPLFFRESEGVYRSLSNHILTIEQVQEELSPEQAVIEYFDADGTHYGVLITQDTAILQALPEMENADAQVKQLIDCMYLIGEQGVDNLVETEERLTSFYQYLIEPFKDQITQSRLIIVPTGALFKVPFAALLTSYEQGSKHYLVEDRSIQTTYSLSYLLMEGTEEDPAPQSVLAVAPEFEVPSEQSEKQNLLLALRGALSPLKYSKEEVDGISRRFKTKTLLGGTGLKESFLQQAPLYQCIALSTHGKANNEDGMQSFVAFGSDSSQWLYASEIYTQDLDADLLTLSACETAVGNYETGEGVISMAYAFRQAGVKSLATTLWSVNDRTSALLMTQFYDGIKKGMSKDMALAAAQRHYLKNATKEQNHPFFWAGFTLIGDASPLDLPSSDTYVWWVFGLGLVVGAWLLLQNWQGKRKIH